METIKPQKRTFWKVNHTNGVEFTGTTDVNQVTVTAQPITYSDNADDVYDPLPSVGTPLEEGDVYAYNGGMVQVRKDHNRTNFEPNETPDLFLVYRANTEGAEWVEGEKVIGGDTRIYQGETYVVVIGHVTAIGQEPTNAPTLWNLDSTQLREWSSYESFEFQNMELGTQVLDEGNTYALINQGQGFRKPSGEFGSFGWELVE